MSKRVPNWDAMPIDEVVEMARQFAAAGIGDVPAPRLAQLVAEIDLLRAQRAAVLSRHERVDDVSGAWCSHMECGPWPCPTAQALGVTS